jgi:hypothetical protein
MRSPFSAAKVGSKRVSRALEAQSLARADADVTRYELMLIDTCVPPIGPHQIPGAMLVPTRPLFHRR